MEKSIKAYIMKYHMIEKNDTIWVALSGGADSVCLLHTLYKLSESLKFSLKAIHINHQLRPKEAMKDQLFCKKLCKKMEIPLLCKSVNVKAFQQEHKMTLEQAGRKVRYDIFSLLEGKVALGHHQDDQVETIIMNILRGTSGNGLLGIKPVNRKYIRPLLDTKKQDILLYMGKHNLSFQTDSTNQDNQFIRNAIRNRVLPLLDEVMKKDVKSNILKLSDLISKDMTYLNQQATKEASMILSKKNKHVLIDNKKISLLNKAIATRVLRQAIILYKGNIVDIEAIHIEQLLNICNQNKTGNGMDLPGQLRVLVQFGYTYIYIPTIIEKIKYELKIPGEVYIKEKNLLITTSICSDYKKTKPDSDTHYFSYDNIHKSLYIRNRSEGDIIYPAKGNGHKKLKKYFIDKKIDRFQRNDLLLIVEGNNILYIQDREYGKEYLPQNGQKILKITVLER
ncbi:MAG: tRNA lysidine(34) synthetase TilS [Clostridiales bacterium]|nr:tRNA lysidine(34) synthetase TilS [Clostridiales bacterium]